MFSSSILLITLRGESQTFSTKFKNIWYYRSTMQTWPVNWPKFYNFVRFFCIFIGSLSICLVSNHHSKYKLLSMSYILLEKWKKWKKLNTLDKCTLKELVRSCMESPLTFQAYQSYINLSSSFFLFSDGGFFFSFPNPSWPHFPMFSFSFLFPLPPPFKMKATYRLTF